MCSLCLPPLFSQIKEALKDGHAPTPALKPRLDYNIATSWPVHNTSAQNSLGSFILFCLGRLCNYTVWNFNFENLPVFFCYRKALVRAKWQMGMENESIYKTKGFFSLRGQHWRKTNTGTLQEEKESFQHAKWKYSHLRVTYSIGIGEVSSIGQPAAEVVVRASSAWHQQKRECVTVTTGRSYIVPLRRNIRGLCSCFIVTTA